MDRKNNFNILRFLAAMLVIFQHAPILTGSNFRFAFSDSQDVGVLAVNIFFLISGFLILGSWNNKKNNGYISSRIFRIMPALIVVNFLVAFVLGPIVATISFKEYFCNISPYFYFIGTTLFVLTGRGQIKGVFNDESPNGSLWTLLFEVACYIMVWVLGMFKLLKTQVLLFLLAVLVFMTVIKITIPYPYPFTMNIAFTRLFICFIIGMLVQQNKEKVIAFIKKDNRAFWIFVSTTILFFVFAFLNVWQIMLLPLLSYIVFYLAFCSWDLSKFGSKHDLSYGIYIYAYPTQMVVAKYLPNIGLVLDLLLVTAITLVLAFLSFSFVEKPLIIMRKKIFKN